MASIIRQKSRSVHPIIEDKADLVLGLRKHHKRFCRRILTIIVNRWMSSMMLRRGSELLEEA